jgi:hypothetical protein
MLTEYPVWNAATAVLKYTVKVSDMLKDDQWFITISDEIWKIRAVAIGGVLKKYLRDRKKENLFQEPGEEPSQEEL